MSLIKLAERLKQLARAHGSAHADFQQGAHCALKCADGKFQLEITRPIKSTKANRFTLWEREVGTFMRDFGVTPANRISVEYPNTSTLYCARIVWRDVDPAKAINPLPKNAAELEQWARTMIKGPGVRITHVNVFTGEI